MLFTQLNTLLANCLSMNLTLVPGPDGQITVTVIPKPKLTQNAEALSTPLRLTGTPEELDVQFVELFGKYATSHQSLAEQIETTTSIMDAAKADSQKKATKALESPKPKTDPKPAKHAAPSAGGESGEEDEDEGGEENTGAQTSQSSTDNNPPAAGESTAEAKPESENLWG